MGQWYNAKGKKRACVNWSLQQHSSVLGADLLRQSSVLGADLLRQSSV